MHLLDVNALIALAWPPHAHHAAAAAWFARHGGDGWATCAMTESAFVRILCQPALAGREVRLREAAQLLSHNTEHPRHRLLPMAESWADVNLRCTGGLVGHRQIADAYVLSTAIGHRARLLTFDAGVRKLLATEEERKAHVTLLKA